MNKIKKWVYMTSGCLLLSAAIPSAAMAEDTALDINIKHQLSLQYTGEENDDLGANNEDWKDSFSQQFQTQVDADITEDLSAFAQGRVLNIDGESGFDDDTGESIGVDQTFFELRQLWLMQRNLFGVVPLGVQAGRMRVGEPRGLWWNSDFDMARLRWDSTLVNGFVGIGEEMTSWRSTTDNDFREDDQDRFRALGEASWQYTHNHFLEGRFLYEDDHSGHERAGTVISAADRDDSDLEAVWAGVRAAGASDSGTFFGPLQYRADLVSLFGDDDMQTSVPAAGGGRTITGSRSRDVEAWAFDGMVIAKPHERVAVTGGYAFGSGDDDPADGTDEGFRQTDLDGNFSRMGLQRSSQRNYGEVLRPDLANIHVLTAGADYALTEFSNVGLTYFNYRQDEEAAAVRGSGLTVNPNGMDDDIGQAADLTLFVNVSEEFSVAVPHVDDIDFRFVAGSFFPGDAYDPNDGDAAYRVFSELKFRF